MPFSLHKLSRLIAYSHLQAVQPLGSTAPIGTFAGLKVAAIKA